MNNDEPKTLQQIGDEIIAEMKAENEKKKVMKKQMGKDINS